MSGVHAAASDAQLRRSLAESKRNPPPFPFETTKPPARTSLPKFKMRLCAS